MVAYPVPKLKAGIPGTVHRMEAADIITETLDPATPFAAYGVPVVISSVNGRARPVGVGDTEANVYGILVRTYPGFANPSAQGLGQDAPISDGKPRNGNVLVRGYINVKVNAGMPVKLGGVYVRIAAATAEKHLGGIEAEADGANTILLTRCHFRGPADAFGNTEIGFRI